MTFTQIPPSLLLTGSNIPYGISAIANGKYFAVICPGILTTPGTVLAQWVEYADASGNLKFDIKDLVKYIPQPFFPKYGANEVIYAPATTPYTLFVWDATYTTYDPSYGIHHSATVYAGGVAYEKDDGNKLLAWLMTVPFKPFTFQPDNQIVDLNQQIWLAYAAVNSSLKCTVYLSDGTSAEDNFTLPGGTAPSLVFVPAGFTQLQLATLFEDDETTVLKYVISGSNIQSRTFIPERRFFRSKKKFSWINSVGGVDSIVCTGQYNPQFDYTDVGGDNYIQPAYATTENGIFNPRTLWPQTKNVITEEQPSVQASTGLKRKLEIDHFREALLSRTLFEDNGSKFVPIQIIRESIQPYPSEAKTFGFQFKYKYAFTNQYFTVPQYMPLLPDYSSEGGALVP